MNALRAFRGLLIAQPILLACSLAATFFTGDPLSGLDASEPISLEPDALGRAFDWVEAQWGAWALFGILLSFLAAYIASLVGLYRYRRWGRTLFLVGFIAGLAVLPFASGESVGSVESIFDDLMVTTDGAILALAFLGPVADKIDGRGAQLNC